MLLYASFAVDHAAAAVHAWVKTCNTKVPVLTLLKVEGNGCTCASRPGLVRSCTLLRAEDLVRKKIRDPTDFEWLKQCRFYWRDDRDTVIISICDVDFEYSFEYLGAPAQWGPCVVA